MKYFTRPPLGTPLNPHHRLNQGLVGYWPLTDGVGNTAKDLSPYSNDGLTNVFQSNPSGWSGGKFGGAMKFNGTNDIVLTSNEESDWYYDFASTQNLRQWTYQRKAAGVYSNLVYSVTGSVYWSYNGQVAAPAIQYLYYGPSLLTNTNGNGHPGTTFGSVVAKWIAPRNGNITIVGKVQDADPGGGNGITFQIDKNITNLHNVAYPNGFGLTTVTLNESVVTGDAIYFIIDSTASNYLFDSTPFQYVVRYNDLPKNKLSGIPTAGNYSCGLWVNSATSSKKMSLICDNHFFQLLNDNGIAKILYGGGQSFSTGYLTLDGGPLSVDKFDHVMCTYDGTTLKLYVNGVLNASVNNANIKSDLAGLRIGGKYTTTNDFFQGSLSEVRAYNRALSASEVQQLYSDPFCMYNQNFNKWLGIAARRGSFLFSKLN